MVPQDLLTPGLLGSLVSLGALGFYIDRLFRGLRNRQAAQIEKKEKDDNDKAFKIKETAEAQASIVKQAVEDRAKDLVLVFDQKMRDQGITIDKKFDELQKMIVAAQQDTTQKITGVNERLTILQRHADLTNGNVKSIRGDISGVEEDIADIFDSMPRSETRNTDQKIRDKQKARRKRRQDIEQDSIDQESKDY